jgi:hypothetical protein
LIVEETNMQFTEFERLTHEIGTVILILLYVARLAALFRRRLAHDIASNARGDIAKGVVEALFIIVTPWRMESTRKHWTRYVEFVVFHLGVFVNIVISFIIAYAPNALTVPARSVALALLGASFIAGGARLYRRANRPEMRIISSPDDYVAMVMVLLFLFTGLLALLGWQPGIITYFVIAALFLVYEPFSKIRHYIYYPFARYFYGATFGKRGVYQK